MLFRVKNLRRDSPVVKTSRSLVLPWQVFKPGMCAAREFRKPELAFGLL